MNLMGLERRSTGDVARNRIGLATDGALEVDLKNEQQLWDLMRPEPETPEPLQEERKARITKLLKRLLTNYPQLLVVPLAAGATWIALVMTQVN